MRLLATIFLLLISTLSYSQEKYELLFKNDDDPSFFREGVASSLVRSGQIYYIQDSDSLVVIYNDYLEFITFKGKTSISYLGSDDGTYKTSIMTNPHFWYIIVFEEKGRKYYYYFHKRFDWMEK
jgi:hypothetical protein